MLTSATISFEEFIISKGFVYKGTCHCIGPKTWKYKSGDFQVYWAKGNKKFKLKHRNKFITAFKPETDIETILSQHMV